uniref:tRNA(Ile)-lysidine synthase, chloroplastic n=1 Tax=Nitella hyalina TaxID=181804 RepID=A0A2H4G3C9_NITHY|nr:hypothetical chloroplast RF62 [Nitella hyalina]APP89466.1 hypothetical protein [Nitella hyalina]WKT08440.1 hypothetical chloroplast RF62 [Nitella hyalina]
MNFFIDFLNRIDHILIERKLLLSRQKVLIAVSGGRDSIILLILLLQLRSNWEWEIGVINCNHMWNDFSRIASSHVSQLAYQMKVNYYQSVSPCYYRKEQKARRWRYKVFQRVAYLHGYDIIITAHTASDRVETLLYNFFKGSSTDGLQSLSWKRNLHAKTKKIRLIRPLLSTTRSELSELSHEIQIPLWLDFTNFNLKIHRNRIRYQLLPYLRFFFNLNLDRSIAQFAEILHGEILFFETLSKILRKKIEIKKCKQKALDLRLIRIFPLAIQRRIIKQFINSQFICSLNFVHIEKIRLISSNFFYQIQFYLPGKSRLRVYKKHLLIPSKNFSIDE